MPSHDVLIIGSGIGASAIARRLVDAGADVAMITGVGCARFKHLDGGVIDRSLLDAAFGETGAAPLQQSDKATVFRRNLLETWAVAKSGVVHHDGFNEGKCLPNDRGEYTVVDESGAQSIQARLVLLTEGANPKIGMAARLRPDFAPEDMVHFGRAFVAGARLNRAIYGDWRTSWNMPAWYSAVPVEGGALVSASTRIENVMRSSRDGRDTLRDLLDSPFAEELDVFDFTGEIGMELVPLQPTLPVETVGFDNLGITADANGMIDPRAENRYDQVLRAALIYAEALSTAGAFQVDWDRIAISLGDMFSNQRTPYHDSSDTGFIEEGAGERRGLIGRLFKR